MQTTPIRKPRSVRLAVLAGVALSALIIGGFGLWAGTAQLASAVQASGHLAVDQRRQLVEHPQGGVLTEILVRDGDLVAEGQVVARLDPVRARAAFGVAQGRLRTQHAVAARWRAAIADRAEIAFPEALTAHADEPAVATVMAEQQSLHAAQRAARASEIAVSEARIAQLEREILGLRAQSDARDRQAALIDQEMAGVESLVSQGLAPVTRKLALEREGARLAGEYGSLIASIARTEQAIQTARLDMARLESDGRRQAEAALAEADAQIRDLSEQVAASGHVLARIEIRAPLAGEIVNRQVRSIGEVVDPGQTLMEIVPAGDELIIEARLAVTDIEEVAIGMAADVRLTGLNLRNTPQLHGHVSYVSADALTPDGQPAHYAVRVEVPAAEIARLGDTRLSPGMPATVLVATGSRTPLDYLLQPLTDSMARAWREG